MKKMLFTEISPFVRYANILYLRRGFAVSGVHAYDTRLVYFMSGRARVRLGDRSFEAGRGALFLWPSDVKYSIVCGADDEAKVMMVNFDYFAVPAAPRRPQPTVPDRRYDPQKAIAPVSFSDLPALSEALHLEEMQVLEPIFQTIAAEYLSKKLFADLLLSDLLRQALLLLGRKLLSGVGDRPIGLCDRVIEYVRQNCAGDLSNEALGKRFNYHPNYINRVMQKHTGQSLHQYVLTYRVSRALELLQTTPMTVTEVSACVGFSSIKHFSQTFKSIYGYSPIHFRK
ncbi:MAG: helix-turn-helix domain-containing protein [Clostridia bacterium]|nr:helix-turn-helix domain-containing protein [Clostridia bacterium]